MVKRESIEFVESRKALSGLVTKFGGQPVWVGAPQWPLSKSTGKPMRFIGQIALGSGMFNPTNAQMAYLFMTDGEEHVDGTWEPDGGENAVILQPGQAPTIKTEPLTEGPTLYRMVKKLFHKMLVPQACEFAVKLTAEEDPDFADEAERAKWDKNDDAKWEAYASALDGNKIGGSPLFIQSTEFPGPGKWRLVLQLDATKVPFYVNFGDAGVGYLFLSEDGQVAKFLWQCA
ncbi:MAG TPA: DUF1963 domain-containing protein [Candidatus Acidoferrales bacterium]|jgi:uncharacterized protein YwqG|nr:DUF1963 domain-containing protein [Candidatus Acidoferrales bacterium]